MAGFCGALTTALVCFDDELSPDPSGAYRKLLFLSWAEASVMKELRSTTIWAVASLVVQLLLLPSSNFAAAQDLEPFDTARPGSYFQYEVYVMDVATGQVAAGPGALFEFKVLRDTTIDATPWIVLESAEYDAAGAFLRSGLCAAQRYSPRTRDLLSPANSNDLCDGYWPLTNAYENTVSVHNEPGHVVVGGTPYEVEKAARVEARGCGTAGAGCSGRWWEYGLGVGLVEYATWHSGGFGSGDSDRRWRLRYARVASGEFGSKKSDVALSTEEAPDFTNPLQIYPNPASSLAWATLGIPATGLRLEVVDMLGRAIRREIWPGAESRIPISLEGLPPGVVLVRLVDGRGLTVGSSTLVIQ
ncbi:MAG: hypothetical protein ACI80V_002173 [Rhodothermales bacterium]|jgi:hypothetical protein